MRYITNAKTGSTDLTITLGNTVPTLKLGIFSNITTLKNVTVRVLTGATGYGTLPGTYTGNNTADNWGNGFRGGGWDGDTIMSMFNISHRKMLKLRS